MATRITSSKEVHPVYELSIESLQIYVGGDIVLIKTQSSKWQKPEFVVKRDDCSKLPYNALASEFAGFNVNGDVVFATDIELNK